MLLLVIDAFGTVNEGVQNLPLAAFGPTVPFHT